MLSRSPFLSITLVGFTSLLGAILFSLTTFAWAPVTSPDLGGDVLGFIDQQSKPWAFGGGAEYREMNYIIGDYNGSTFIIAADDDDHFGIQDGGAGSTSFSARGLCRYSNNPLGSWPGCNPWQSSGLSLPTVYAIHLTDTYADRWAGTSNDPTTWPQEMQDLIATPGGGDFDNDHVPQCDPWDMLCWFSGAIGNVVDGFQSLADNITKAFQALGDWIANLIMPSNADGSFDNRFTDFFTTVQSTMTERLGFLLFPFTFIGDLFASLATIYNPFGGADALVGNCTSGSNLGVPNLLGDNTVGFNLCGIEDTPIWTPAVTLLRFVWIIGVVGFLHKKYFSVVKA